MEQAIAFATLFLGLITGPQEIALDVGAAVTSVELRLDGELLATLTQEPWVLEWDAGAVPIPHHLVATAKDVDGNRLGSAEQWLNLPRSAAEVEIVLDESEQGTTARLSWQSLTASDPQRVEALLDDQPLEVADPRTIELPAVDLRTIHILRVELTFDDDLVASKEVTFGGTYLDRVQSELTALPLDYGKKKASINMESFRGRVRAGEEPITVAAVERGPIDVVVVRDKSAVEPLRALLRLEAQSKRRERSLTNVNLDGQLKRLLPIRAAAKLRFTWPGEDTETGVKRFDLFPHSQELSNVHGGLAYLLALFAPPQELSPDQRLADAVAIAGMSAMRRNRRRAVILLLGPEPEDRSRMRPEHARRYLELLGVPLFVWSVSPSDQQARDWQTVDDISSMSRWRRAASRLWSKLDAQLLVWVEGRHLPQNLHFDSGSS